jgi:hypothetical protein
MYLPYRVELSQYFFALPFCTPAHTPANRRDTPSRRPILAQEAVGGLTGLAAPRARATWGAEPRPKIP